MLHVWAEGTCEHLSEYLKTEVRKMIREIFANLSLKTTLYITPILQFPATIQLHRPTLSKTLLSFLGFNFISIHAVSRIRIFTVLYFLYTKNGCYLFFSLLFLLQTNPQEALHFLLYRLSYNHWYVFLFFIGLWRKQ